MCVASRLGPCIADHDEIVVLGVLTACAEIRRARAQKDAVDRVGREESTWFNRESAATPRRRSACFGTGALQVHERAAALDPHVV